MSYGIMQCMMFMCGARIGFYGGDIKLLVNDIQELRPTVFVSVPRLLNRIYDKVPMSIYQGLPLPSLVAQSDHSWDVKSINNQEDTLQQSHAV